MSNFSVIYPTTDPSQETQNEDQRPNAHKSSIFSAIRQFQLNKIILPPQIQQNRTERTNNPTTGASTAHKNAARPGRFPGEGPRQNDCYSTPSSTDKVNPPWWNSDCEKATREKKRCSRRLQRSRNQKELNNFRQANSVARRVSRQARRAYENNQSSVASSVAENNQSSVTSSVAENNQSSVAENNQSSVASSATDNNQSSVASSVVENNQSSVAENNQSSVAENNQSSVAENNQSSIASSVAEEM